MEMTRGEMQDLLTKFASQNPEYRQALLRKPREVVESQFQVSLPENVNLKVLEETADTAYVVLPHVVQEGAELSDADVEMVAGGANVKEAKCDKGIASTVVEVNASLF